MIPYPRFAKVLVSSAALVFIGGCARSSAPPPTPPAAAKSVWLEQGLEVDGVKINLGHRERATAEDVLEPIASLTKDGNPVADAMVFMQIVADGKSAGDEEAAVYDATSDKQAVYTPGKLPLPKENPFAIRYRILFAGAEQEWTKDVVVAAPDGAAR